MRKGAYAAVTRGRCECSPLARRCVLALRALVLVVAAIASVEAQIRRPKAETLTSVETPTVAPGAATKLTLNVRLPETFHVQSDKPRDPLLIPTSLTIEAPKGVSVARITYPKAEDLKQEGEEQPLSVFGHEFEIGVQLKVAKSVKPAEIVIPGRLRYQPCDELMCYPPTTANVSWTLTVK